MKEITKRTNRTNKTGKTNRDTYTTDISKDRKIELTVQKFENSRKPLELLKKYLLTINPMLSNLRQEDLEDFLQSYMMSCLKSFRNRNESMQGANSTSYSQFLAYCLFRAKAPLPNCGNTPLITLRGINYYQNKLKKRSEMLDLDRPTLNTDNGYSLLDTLESNPELELDNHEFTDYIDALLDYVDSKVGQIGVKYLLLYLFDDLPTAEIDRILDLEFRERDYLQQRVIYHCERFETGWDTWKLHHDYFGIGIDTNLGLVGDRLNSFLSQLSESDLELYELVKSGSSVEKAKGKYQNGKYVLPLATKNQWRSILKSAKKIRNYKSDLDS